MALRPRARNPRGVRVQELFRTPPDAGARLDPRPVPLRLGRVFQAARSTCFARASRCFPRACAAARSTKAVAFVTRAAQRRGRAGRHLPGDGEQRDDVRHARLRAGPSRRRDRLGARCASCWSSRTIAPTASPACRRCGTPALPVTPSRRRTAPLMPAVANASEWLRDKQVTDVVGDWADARPHAPPGGWAFQYENAHYPDVDDTAVVGMLLHRQGDPAQRRRDRAGAGLDHRHAVARRRLGRVRRRQRQVLPQPHPVRRPRRAARSADRRRHRALRLVPRADRACGPDESGDGPRRSTWLIARQEADGSWFGRWGTNYIYGTWSVLCALNAAGVPHRRSGDPPRRRVSRSRRSARTAAGARTTRAMRDAPHGRYRVSTPSQTAWALLGLMAAGEVEHPAVARGIA